MEPQTIIQEVAPSLYLLRVNDRQTRYFEALWEIPEGITYNAYLLKTSEGAVLFDGWKQPFTDAFVDALKQLTPLDEIKHIVIHHMEPDHSGTLPKILALTEGKPTVWGHPFTQRLIAGLYGLQPAFQAVKSGARLTFGGRELVFYHAPWLHWPETIVTHLPQDNLLLTGDIFGGYGIPEGVFDDEVALLDHWLDLARKYTISVIGHYKDKIGKNIQTLADKYGLQPSMILPAHGLLWRQAPQRVVQAYLDWGAGKPQPGKVTVVYSSMYRYVERAVQVAVDELRAQGFRPVVHRMVDDERAGLADILSDLADSEAIVLGTETYESDIFPLTEFLLHEMVNKVAFAKPLLAIAVFGWAAAAGKKLRTLLDNAPYEPVRIVEFKGLLTEASEAQIREGVRAMVADLRAE